MPEVMTPASAAECAQLGRRLTEVFGAPDLFVRQGGAILARGIARPGTRALGLITGAYGEGFEHWLRQGDTTVESLAVGVDRSITAEQLREARHLDTDPGAALHTALLS